MKISNFHCWRPSSSARPLFRSALSWFVFFFRDPLPRVCQFIPIVERQSWEQSLGWNQRFTWTSKCKADLRAKQGWGERNITSVSPEDGEEDPGLVWRPDPCSTCVPQPCNQSCAEPQLHSAALISGSRRCGEVLCVLGCPVSSGLWVENYRGVCSNQGCWQRPGFLLFGYEQSWAPGTWNSHSSLWGVVPREVCLSPTGKTVESRDSRKLTKQQQ